MNEQLTEIVKQLILKKIELKQCAAYIRNVIKQVVMQKFPNKAHEEVCNSVRYYFGRMQDMYNQTVQLLHESMMCLASSAIHRRIKLSTLSLSVIL